MPARRERSWQSRHRVRARRLGGQSICANDNMCALGRRYVPRRRPQAAAAVAADAMPPPPPQTRRQRRRNGRGFCGSPKPWAAVVPFCLRVAGRVQMLGHCHCRTSSIGVCGRRWQREIWPRLAARRAPSAGPPKDTRRAHLNDGFRSFEIALSHGPSARLSLTILAAAFISLRVEWSRTELSWAPPSRTAAHAIGGCDDSKTERANY